MNQIVRCIVALAILVSSCGQTMAQSPVRVAQNPLAGSRVFGAKGCVKCHAVNGVGGTLGPDLGRNPLYRSFFDFAAAMWNHLPKMAERMHQLEMPRPRLDPWETGDLLAFLATRHYFDSPGNPQDGRRLFSAKQCVVCHQVGGVGGVLGPNLKRYNPTLRVDQVSEYYTSAHGRLLKEFNDSKVATCVSCHPAHAIRPASDPTSSVHPLRVAETCGRCHADAAYMQSYGIPTDQLQKYQESVHWRTLSVRGDLAAPTCNNCHGNHGAVPPGVAWVGNACGQCHTVQADFFNQSAHAAIFVQMGTPGCAACHTNHAMRETNDEMLGLGDGAVCTACHSAEDAGGKVAVEMRQRLDTLHREYDKAHDLLLRAEHAGMEVSQAQVELQEGKTALIKARTAMHTFTVATVQQAIEPGLSVSTKAYARGVEALDELRFRRTGLGVSVLIILAIIVGLRLKLRQLERRDTDRLRPGNNDTES